MDEITAISETATLATSAVSSALESLYDWGLEVIRTFQAAGNPALTLLAKGFTALGEPAFYLAVFAILFWCIDEKKGFWLGMTVFLSNGVNLALKDALRVPRPFIRNPSVALIPETGFSTPSGHAQNSTAFWVSAAARGTGGGKRRRAARIVLAIALSLCIGLSRVYLGVHYPTDVLAGWAVGALVALASAAILPRAMAALGGSARWQAFIAAGRARAAESGKTLRAYKLALAAALAFALNAISPLDSSMGGLTFGFAAGYVYLTDSRARAFRASSGTWAQKAARLAFALAVLALIYFGLKAILPGEGSAYYGLCRFIRYGLVGLWASLGAPRLFQRLSLA